ncbi:MAG TPA: hypothetical protein VN026_17740, partial [Bacteroidia bacterium]|nr:hypothetical protein [Bacteroidia bacterium]
PSDKTEQQRLLSILLINTILKNASRQANNPVNLHKPIILNKTETEIYQSCLPKAVKTMLTKISNLNLTFPSDLEIETNEQPAPSTNIFSSLKNKAAALYNYYMGRKVVKN